MSGGLLTSVKWGPVIPVTAEQLAQARRDADEFRSVLDQFGQPQEWRDVYAIVRAARVSRDEKEG